MANPVARSLPKRKARHALPARGGRDRVGSIRATALLAAVACAGVMLLPGRASARGAMIDVPLDPARWTATDSLRSETWLGRPSLYVDRGVAIARDVALADGVVEFDLATAPSTSFLGVVFHARSPRFSEVLFLRPGESGTPEALQYGPALNGLGAAWQAYRMGATAAAEIPKGRWFHLRIELAGTVARVFVDTASTPTLVVRDLAGTGGLGLGLWTGAYGHGAYFSNIRYQPSSDTVAAPAPAPPLRGTLTRWEITEPFGPEAFTPARLPDLARYRWRPVTLESRGFVLVNRYFEGPNASPPRDPATRAVLVDSVMTGRVAGSKIVYARTVVNAERDGMHRLQFAYSDGIVIYVNGKPVSFAMNPQGFRDGLGRMSMAGDAAYVHLVRGRNEIVFAVMELGGGWAFSGRLEPPAP